MEEAFQFAVNLPCKHELFWKTVSVFKHVPYDLMLAVTFTAHNISLSLHSLLKWDSYPK